jgi:hypothetical protein
MTSFATILRHAVESTPGAVGGAFAASDGEMVDSFCTIDATDWALITAHYGVLLSLMHSAFGTWHFGGVEYFTAQHSKYDVMVHAVDSGYYAIMVLGAPAQLAHGFTTLQRSVDDLRREMA